MIKSIFPLSLLLAMIAGALAAPWSGSAAAATVQPFACDATDSPDKGWMLPVYVYQPGQDKYDSDRAALLNMLWETDQTFDASAHRLGVSRRIRYLQDGDCRLIVAKLPFVKGRNRAEMNKALEESLASQPELVRKLWPTNRIKPLFLVRDDEITGSCTGGGPHAGFHTGGPILPRWCWGSGGLTHELVHTFGLSHCNDDMKNGPDPVCRGTRGKPECQKEAGAGYHLDSCRTDDFRYFEPTPVRQPPLPTNRNVAFSPHLIQNQPSPVWNFRFNLMTTDKCLQPSGQQVVLHTCSDAKSQVWQRSIDGDGYLTIRNAATGLCLEMTDKVTTDKCVDKERTQQWLAWGEKADTGFYDRASNGRLSIQKNADGAPAVRSGGGDFIAELLGAALATASPTTSPTPTKSAAPTATPTQQTPVAPTATPAQQTPVARTVKFIGANGACLTATRSMVHMGSCRAKWRIVNRGAAVQVRSGSRCLALGKAGNGRRSTVLTGCRVTAKGQLWLLEPQRNGSVTLKSATTRATRLVGTGPRARVHAKAAYPGKSLRFTIR